MPDHAKLRAWWAHRQGLIEPLAADPRAVLGRCGWVRSVGSVNPYLTLFSRAGIGRIRAESAVADQTVHELPAARGCGYYVPAEDFAIALRLGARFHENSAIRVAKQHLGVTEPELDRLCEAILRAVESGPLTPAEMKPILGDAVRHLGDEGKKRGQTTTHSLGIGRLQAQGRLRRVPVDGRLDHERYAYAAWGNGPLSDGGPTEDEALRALAHRFFSWIGPARLSEFRGFAAATVKDAQAAVADLGLVPLDEDFLVLPEDRDAFEAFVPPAEPAYRLVASLDSHLLHRRDAASLVDQADAQRAMYGEHGPVLIGGVQELSNHAILDRGRLVGLWEYDPEAREIVWASFVGVSEPLREAVARTERFIRDELGDARSFSLDSPKSRRPSLEALRAAGEGTTA
ncbi:MAG: winged helix DNA-binding domain-containing protein [Fimbriimonadaceae bacterium]|nr:winged helix DNA-binding domain-containing protein [Fimbriimonadaceae bacterium]